MINVNNLEDMLKVIGYTRNSDKKVYEKHYDEFDCEIEVDFTGNGAINYPEEKGMKVTRKTICNFSQPENFVVLECITRLMDKGYRPEHIELERLWPLGHDKKGGYADILVKNEKGKTSFLVECKTDGKEYLNEYNKIMNDGGQLFSYWQQERSCEWLSLYSSDFDGKEVKYTTECIDCSDDANILVAAEKNNSIKLYKDAHTVEELFSTWDETYEKRMCGDVVFSEDSQAYNIGIKPRRKKDLVDFTPDDKIVNRFEEILRHNNVSDKENAFNRLIALFICKLVDESTKSEDDEVEFQYKQGTDTFESLQDRLQRLHSDGMKMFMREEIFYVSADYPEKLFSTYTGSKRKKAIEDLQNVIRVLKYYSNNDFSFIDVHNEELFYQNGKILVEMVQLFEKYRIVYTSKHQFLGDLFEQLLNKGFKQNEGQFFTPIPITRFIWDSLPVERMIKTNRGTEYPRIVDYACGAGHFLTEAIETLNYHIKSDGDNGWARDCIFGIEKDYRLARVAKISLFMNGAGEGNIVFGDGLENDHEKGIKNGSFDILVANPPYSVKDFKQHLLLKNNSFTLLDKVGMNGREIETLFVERIAQLLKPKGIAAVILPNTILSKDSSVYVGAREQLLNNFYIRAIVDFGKKTFGATDTKTVVLFLEKYDEPPRIIDLQRDAVNAIFQGDKIDDWMDEKLFKAYTKHIGVKRVCYEKFLNKKYSLKELNRLNYFKMYVESFELSSEAKKMEKKTAFQNKGKKAQQAEYLDTLYSYINTIEEEKILYFSLAWKKSTVVITAPSDNKEEKDFLGYEWSQRKGNEGIKIFSPGGKLYDEANRIAENTIAGAIKKSFYEEIPKLNEKLKEYVKVVDTVDMLDFSKTYFDKEIRLSASSPVEFKTKHKLKPIKKIFAVIESGSRPKGGVGHISNGVISLGGGHIDNESGCLQLESLEYVPTSFYKESKKGRVEKQDILICKDGALTGKVAMVRNELGNEPAMLNEHVFLLRSGDVNIQYYVFQLLYSRKGQCLLESFRSGAGAGGLNKTNMQNIKLPMPPPEIIKKIVDKCKKVDKKYKATRMSIDTYKKKIEEILDEFDVDKMTTE